MARRLKTTVYADPPSGGLAKAFGPQDPVDEIPAWATDQWGDHVYEEYDPQEISQEAIDLNVQNQQFREEVAALRADNEDVRRERDELKTQLEQRDARIADLEEELDQAKASGITNQAGTSKEPGEGPSDESTTVETPAAETALTDEDLDSKNVEELKDLAKDRGIEGASGMRRAELLEALRGAAK